MIRSPPSLKNKQETNESETKNPQTTDPTQHDPQSWLQWFTDCCEKRNTHAPRATIIAQTADILRHKGFNGQIYENWHKAYEGSVVRTLHPPSTDLIDQEQSQQNDLTNIHVVRQDCIEVAIALKAKHGNIIVLNMGAPGSPGVGPQGAQEENLHRRSNLKTCTLGKAQTLYPIPDDGCLYHPDVLFFRGAEGEGYPFFPPVAISVVTVAAVKAGILGLSPDEVLRTKDKIRVVLQTCQEFGHKVIVMSALGCGAFRNPPDVVANIFKEILSNEFTGVFSHVYFAILEDHNSKGVNGSVFAETFGVPLLPHVEQSLLNKV